MYYHYCTVTYETFVLVVFHVNLFFELLVFATVTALLFFCTCLCVSFIQTGQRNRSKLLADDDIPLTCIDAIYIGTCFTILYLSVTQHYIGIFPSKIIIQKYVTFTDFCKCVHEWSQPKRYRLLVNGMHKPINNVKGWQNLRKPYLTKDNQT